MFESFLGPYPFYEDGLKWLKLHIWVEHQSCMLMVIIIEITDEVLIISLFMEGGHEWFGNSLSCSDHAEMWLHESFTTYGVLIYGVSKR